MGKQERDLIRIYAQKCPQRVKVLNLRMHMHQLVPSYFLHYPTILNDLQAFKFAHVHAIPITTVRETWSVARTGALGRSGRDLLHHEAEPHSDEGPEDPCEWRQARRVMPLKLSCLP
jgi:hypothetical protein